MSQEPENLVLQLLRDMRGEMSSMRGDISSMRSEMATKDDIAEVRSEMHSLRADIASDLLEMRAENNAEHHKTREQVVGLRRAVVEYHSAVIGHGILISELEARLRRVEQHLNFPEAH